MMILLEDIEVPKMLSLIFELAVEAATLTYMHFQIVSATSYFAPAAEQ